MPKIIENIREQLLQEVKRQIAENGYGKTTIRSVAGACGLGIGLLLKNKIIYIKEYVYE